MDLAHLLHATFGFPGFRANQEAVCRAATDGRDVLLVMPTGAGKSLCYQLPAIARQAAGHNSAALVISPLIALMDDQAAKLSALGLRVGRIHSGLSRDDARQACRQYLDGTLQFLFIAPERMRVPGFPEMLSKRKPSLIAIDEAHCISAWGHDFRPDYRTLGDYLPQLRPTPILALTATATPTVQQDIVAQLNFRDPALFIHGFRRDNLAIEVIEMSRPRRNEFAVNFLKDKANRPAIVYAPSRKAAEELAGVLGRNAAAYHAGLDPATRERVQRHFLSGSLEIVVATIAFGMGIDKADVRTVIHTALPASVEAFYQEIGRAGRDGLPSRTLLLHSFVDRKIHEGFLERDYPPTADLARVAAALTEDFLMPEPLWRRLRMTPDVFAKAVEKLTGQGAAQVDLAGNVRGTGGTGWQKTYETQVAFRRAQIDRMAAFAESTQCRMTALIRHFGDTGDGTRPCGHCDACAPSEATGQTFRPPTTEDLRQLAAILRALDGQGRATGKLHSELAAGALRNTPAAKDRKTFDTLLDALCRAALLTITSDTFTNAEGSVIPYRKAALTHEGRQAAATGTLDAPDLLLRDTEPDSANTGTRRSGQASSGRSSKTGRKTARLQTAAAYNDLQKDLETRLRDWRRAEAGGKPAFIVFSDAVLAAIVQAAPLSIPELRTIPGIGPEKAERYGASICALCRNGTPSMPQAAPPKVQGKPVGARPPLEAFRPAHLDSPVRPAAAASTVPLQTGIPFTRPTNPKPETPLTPAQQALDLRLREWRRSESERLGLPQFFVLGSSTLRSIVLNRPHSLPQLESIAGIGPEKAARFGAEILHLCEA